MINKKNLDKYQPSVIESKWQKKWEEGKIYSPDLDLPAGKVKPFYNLMMFPYLSAEGMHVGNMYAFTGSDIYGRFKRMQGHDTFEPIGLDGFGIHSENYAIKVGRHPKEQAKISQENFYRQLHSIGNAYDWTRTVETYDPDYYKWTQWIFIQLFKKGLAYRKKAPVNFCPSCKTVLADEQVIEGACERCGTVVEKKDLEQWFFKITDYADRLLDGLTRIDWSEKVKIAQKQWIGKSQGVNLTQQIKDLNIKIEAYDSVPQTFMAQTFAVIAPEHPLAEKLVKGTEYERPVMEFIERMKKKKASKRYENEKEMEGIFTGRYIDNPFETGDLPIWVASYAIYGYGTGIVNCSVHDERDFAFAKKYNIRLHPVMVPSDSKRAERVMNIEECFHHDPEGIILEPVQFKGRKWAEAREEIIDFMVKKGWAYRASHYHLRDWLISRQRYWGSPIPMIFCEMCASQKIGYLDVGSGKLDLENLKSGNQDIRDSKDQDQEYPISNFKNSMHGWFPVSDDQLPILLPDVKDWKPLGTGKSPLANHPEFYKTSCPKCGGEAKRETDVSDTFLDSAWYFFRYISTEFKDKAFDQKRVEKWLPVDMYIGGAEHSVLHLLYTRFLTMFFKDIGLIDFEEPFKKFRAHGLIIAEGAKMSKSKGNVVNPDRYIKEYGADTLRMYLMFMGPFEYGGDFRDAAIGGIYRFLTRVWQLQGLIDKKEETKEEKVILNRTIKKVTDDLEGLHYNTAIASLMTILNFFSRQGSVSKESFEKFLILLAPFAPHITEELYQKLKVESGKLKINEKLSTLNSQFSIHCQLWPLSDKKYLKEEEVLIVVQVNGKVRDTINVKCQISNDKFQIEKKAKESEKVRKYLEEKDIKKVVYVEGKIINFVTE